jgi:uncharacterized coiled-coil protein SlyX
MSPTQLKNAKATSARVNALTKRLKEFTEAMAVLSQQIAELDERVSAQAELITALSTRVGKLQLRMVNPTPEEKAARYSAKIQRVLNRHRTEMDERTMEFMEGVRTHIISFGYISDAQAAVVDRIVGELS